LKVRGAGEAAGNGRRLEGGRLTRRSKVGERPDGRAPPVGLWRKKKRGKALCWAGGGDGLGRCGLTARARGKKRKRPLARGVGGLKEGAGRLERKERERERVFSFSFKFLFKFIFQTFKLQSNRNPCIRIMMHKHLLSLNYFGDV
jgi:hypothetical protein